MRSGRFIVKLVFGLLGAIYTVVGAVGLTLAARAAGDIRRIFALPEEELAFAICGTVFSILGVAFLLVTILLILADRRRARLREELLAWGVRVQGTVTDVYIDRSVRVNGYSPVVAKVRCSLPSGETTLKSRRLWKACPSTGDTVTVIYDPKDEKQHVIEFEGEA